MEQITVLQWNADGLLKKPEIKTFILDQNYSIACIQETFHKPKTNYNLKGYQVFRSDREDGNKGGVAILVKNGIEVTSSKNYGKAEAIQVDIRLKQDKKLTIINVYSPPPLRKTG